MNSERKKDCNKCLDCRMVRASGNFEFHGCFHRPYRGKMCAEIKTCPNEARVAAPCEVEEAGA